MKSQEELQLFVKKKLKNGYPEGELINDLLQKGFTSEEIQKAIFDPPATGKESKREDQQQPTNYPFWFVLTSATGVVGLSIVSVSLFSSRIIGYVLISIGLIGMLVKFIIPIKKIK